MWLLVDSMFIISKFLYGISYNNNKQKVNIVIMDETKRVKYHNCILNLRLLIAKLYCNFIMPSTDL